MERPKHPLRIFGATALLGAGVFFGLQPQDHIMSAEDYLQRENLLSSYPYTYQAVQDIKSYPFFNRQVTANGGGMFKNEFIWGPYIEVYDKEREGFISDEAGLHETMHLEFMELTRRDPNFADNFMDAVAMVVQDDVPHGYFRTLAYGLPGTKWKGVDRSNDTEWFAAIGSWGMGGERNPYPQPLMPYYSQVFDLYNQTKTYTDVRYKNFEPNIDWSKPLNPTK